MFLLRTVVVVVVVVIAQFLYCIFKIYSSIWLSSHKYVINSVFSVMVLFAWQVSKAKDLLVEESKEHALIVERDGKYVPVFEDRRRPKPKSTSDGE